MDNPCKSKPSSRQRGQWAEELAYQFLCQHNLQLIVRNYHCRQGEIDLIMQQDKTVVFVEVRYRVDERYGGSAESIDRRKQQKLITTALHFLQTHPTYQQSPCRFDAILVAGTARNPQLHWVESAFSAS